MKPGNPVPHHDSRRSDFISQKSGVTVDKSAPRWYVMAELDCRGVVAKRLGSGLQNRSDRFDSGPRLHFFCFDFCFATRRLPRLARRSLSRARQCTPSLSSLAKPGIHPNGCAKGGWDTCVARRRYSVTYLSMLPRAALPVAASRIQMASQKACVCFAAPVGTRGPTAPAVFYSISTFSPYKSVPIRTAPQIAPCASVRPPACAPLSRRSPQGEGGSAISSFTFHHLPCPLKSKSVKEKYFVY